MKTKWNVLCAVLLCAFALIVSPQVSYAASLPDDLTETTGAAEPGEAVYKVTIQFNKNGGTGTMSGVTVTSDQTNVTLPANTFKKTGYVFAGWSVKKNGSAVYENKANAAAIATAENNEKVITLYAQWKLKAPTIKKVTSTPSEITVKYAKNSKASGYEIMYSDNKNFAEYTKKGVKRTFTTTVTSKNTTSAQLFRVVPNKKYYVKVRSYKKSGGKKSYSDWSKATTHKVKNGKTLANMKGSKAVGIEADVTLDGAGTGYHAKLVMGNAASAVSFGIQYDQFAATPYSGRSVALIENISSNAAGGQTYIRPGNKDLKRKKTYHLMMIAKGDGNYDVYVDYKKIGSCYQPAVKQPEWYRIEAAGRLNGDKVNASFKNVKCGNLNYGGIEGLFVLGDNLTFHKVKSNPGIKYKLDKKTNTIKFTGTIRDMNGDWDVDYERASGIIQAF